MVLDVLEAVDYDVGEATLMLSSPEYAPKLPLESLREQVVTSHSIIFIEMFIFNLLSTPPLIRSFYKTF